MFIKYRHRFAHGPGEWKYDEIIMAGREDTRKEAMGLFADYACEEEDWSEHYRGTDIEEVRRPPRKWLEDEVVAARWNMQAAKRKIERYERMLGKTKKRKGKKS